MLLRQNVKYVCPYTKKQFKSEGAWENYKGSKKYKQLVAKHGAKEEIKEETPVEEETPAEDTPAEKEAEPAEEANLASFESTGKRI